MSNRPRIVVCGGRDYADQELVFKTLDMIWPSEIAQGGASGADRLALEWANKRGIQCRSYPAAWKTHGRAAGPIRNQEMLDEFKPDAVLAFPGGRGTADITARAEKAGIPVLRPDSKNE